jgi:hypothetical protein
MALVLSKAAMYDARTISDADVDAWLHLVGHIDFEIAMTAVDSHFLTSEKRLMPVHLMPDHGATGGMNWR